MMTTCSPCISSRSRSKGVRIPKSVAPARLARGGKRPGGAGYAPVNRRYLLIDDIFEVEDIDSQIDSPPLSDSVDGQIVWMRPDEATQSVSSAHRRPVGMNNMMNYKGYFGSSEFDPEDELFHGKLAYIRDLVLFEGEDAKGLALNALVTEALTDHLNRQEK